MCISLGLGIALAGGAAAGGAMYAGSKSAKAMESAAKEGRQTEWAMYTQSRADLEPWRERGKEALGRLSERVMAGPGEFTESPGYQYRLGEGERAINRNMAAWGDLGGSRNKRALLRFVGNEASAEFDRNLARYYNSLRPFQSLAGLGQTATTTTAGLGSQAASNIAGLGLAAGEATASGYTNAANIMGNVVGQGLGAYGMYKGLTYQPKSPMPPAPVLMD